MQPNGTLRAFRSFPCCCGKYVLLDITPAAASKQCRNHYVFAAAGVQTIALLPPRCVWLFRTRRMSS